LRERLGKKKKNPKIQGRTKRESGFLRRKGGGEYFMKEKGSRIRAGSERGKRPERGKGRGSRSLGGRNRGENDAVTLSRREGGWSRGRESIPHTKNPSKP